MNEKANGQKLPRTHAAYAKALSDMALAGYFAGFRDRYYWRGSLISRERSNVRRAIRAEIQRWFGKP